MGQYTRYKSVIKITDLMTNMMNVLTGVADVENTSPTKWFKTVSSTITATTYSVILESTSLVDSYLTTDDTQTFRIAFVGDFTGAYIKGDLASVTAYIGTDQQINIDTNSNLSLDNSLVPITVVDIAEDPVPPTTADPTSTDVKNYSNGRDLSLSVTSRGFVFAITAIDTVNQRHRNSMICIQRPVNPSTGVINTQGTCPIFCLYHNYSDRDPNDADYPLPTAGKVSQYDSVPAPDSPYPYKGANGLYFIVVRESDINTASKNLDTYNVAAPSGADNNNYTPGTMYSLSFDWTYPVTFDDSSYVMKYPFGFMTSRNTYIDEMDLISFVNASVFPSSYDINIGVYGETTNRDYETSFGVDAFGEYISKNDSFLRNSIVGSRIAVLKTGGGI